MLRYIKQQFLEEAQNWILWLPVFFGLGIGLYFALPFEPSSGDAIRAVTLPLILLVGLRRRLIWRFICIALLFTGMGFSVTKIKADSINTVFIDTNDVPVTISGNITEISYVNDVPRFTLNNLRIDELGKNLPDKVRLNIRTKIRDEVRVGDRIITDAVIMPPPSAATPGGYDFARQAYFQGIGGTGYSVKQVVKLKWGQDDDIIKRTSHLIGQKIYSNIDGDAGAIAAALINGDRSKISTLTNDDFRNSGLYHMLSISGLHLVIVTGVFFIAARFLMSLSYHASEVWPIKKIAAVIALIGGLLYLLISGMQVPAERSYIMAGLILVGVILDRLASPMRSVALAAFVILLFEPDALLTPSFQMSFAAAAALIAAYEYISRHHPNFYKRKILAWFAGAALTSIVAGLATTAYAAFHFGRLTNYGLIANMAAAPVTAFLVMPAAVLGVLLMPLGLEWLALKPMGWGIEVIMKIAEVVGSWKGATTPVPYVPDAAIIFFTVGFLWLLLWQRKWRLMGFAPILLALIIPMFQPQPDIFVSQDGKLIAINNNGRLEFNKTRENFTSKSWLQYFGQDEMYEITDYKIKDCYLFGKKLELKCDGGRLILPVNSVVYLPNKIVQIAPVSKRIWTKPQKSI